eukprot:scaffold28885_cov22-Tisochrysis_lutea.AAC.3
MAAGDSTSARDSTSAYAKGGAQGVCRGACKASDHCLSCNFVSQRTAQGVGGSRRQHFSMLRVMLKGSAVEPAKPPATACSAISWLSWPCTLHRGWQR